MVIILNRNSPVPLHSLPPPPCFKVITNPDTPLKKSGGNRFLGGLAVGGSVYDKLRSDFSGSGSTSNSTSNSASNNRRSGADRCIQIKPQCVDRDQAEAWDDLFDKIREGVLFSFSMVKRTWCWLECFNFTHPPPLSRIFSPCHPLTPLSLSKSLRLKKIHVN